jgi:GNAT superfamily N-acetyltransferase
MHSLRKRAQVAYKMGKPVGFVEYHPIEVANVEVDGQDIMAIWCIKVREEERGLGIGSRLLQACQADTQALGRKGIVVACWDPFWMTQAIFQRHGFADVGPAGPNGRVLFKVLKPLEAPRWIGRKPSHQPVEGRVLLDIYHTDRCPIHWRNTHLVKDVARECGSAVEICEHPTDDRAEMRRHGTAYGVHLNGRLLVAGPLADTEAIGDRFRKELARLSGR